MYIHFVCKNCREVSTNEVDINKYSQLEFTKIHAKVKCIECKCFSFIHIAGHLEPIPRRKKGDDGIIQSISFNVNA